MSIDTSSTTEIQRHFSTKAQSLLNTRRPMLDSIQVNSLPARVPEQRTGNILNTIDHSPEIHLQRQQILQNAGTAMLSHANQAPQAIMRLFS